MSCCASCSFSTSLGFTGSTSAVFVDGESSVLISPVRKSFGTGAIGDTGVGTAAGAGVGSIGVAGGVSFASFNRRASRFFSSVRRKTLIVVRNDL
jgi:hypothetical protein